jgi:hypothetical protein
LRDRSVVAFESCVGRVRLRGKRKAGGGCSARQACVFGGPAGSHCGSYLIEARPRAVARKEEVGRRFAVWFAGGALEAIVAAMELLQLGEARWFSGPSPTLLSIGVMAFQT